MKLILKKNRYAADTVDLYQLTGLFSDKNNPDKFVLLTKKEYAAGDIRYFNFNKLKSYHFMREEYKYFDNYFILIIVYHNNPIIKKTSIFNARKK